MILKTFNIKKITIAIKFKISKLKQKFKQFLKQTVFVMILTTFNNIKKIPIAKNRRKMQPK